MRTGLFSRARFVFSLKREEQWGAGGKAGEEHTADGRRKGLTVKGLHSLPSPLLVRPRRHEIFEKSGFFK